MKSTKKVRRKAYFVPGSFCRQDKIRGGKIRNEYNLLFHMCFGPLGHAAEYYKTNGIKEHALIKNGFAIFERGRSLFCPFGAFLYGNE